MHQYGKKIISIFYILLSAFLSFSCIDYTYFVCPVITNHSVDSVVEQYDELVLFCDVEIDDRYEIGYQWFKKESLTEEPLLLENETDRILTVNTDSLGECFYYCKVNNKRNSKMITKTELISVNIIRNEKLFPKITYQSNDMRVEQYDELILYCVSESENTADYSYQWFVKDTPVSKEVKLDEETNNYLSIDTDSVHSEYYYCTVSNTDYRDYEVTSSLIKVEISEKQIEYPVIVSCSESVSLMPGSSITLFVNSYIKGIGDISYQWYSAANSNVFEKEENEINCEISLESLESDRKYYCEITNTYIKTKKVIITPIFNIHVYTEEEIISMKREMIFNRVSDISFSYDNETGILYSTVEDCKLNVKPENVCFVDGTLLIPLNVLACDKYAFSMVLQKEISDSDAGILLSFDDYYPVWNEVIQLFDEKEIIATWFITGNGTDELTKKIAGSRQSLGYHGKEHMMFKKYNDVVMGSNYLDKFDWEVFHCLPNFKQLGAFMSAYAIPHGSGLWYDWQIERLLTQYKVVRDYEPYETFYSVDEIRDIKLISSQAIDNRYFETKDDFKKQMERKIIIAKLANMIYPCTSHTFSDNENENGGFVLTYDRLNILFELIKNYKIKTYSYDELFK